MDCRTRFVRRNHAVLHVGFTLNPVGAGVPAKQVLRCMAPAPPVFAGMPASTGIASGLTGDCHKVWQRLLERAPPARRNRELRSLLRLFRANYSCGICARTPWCMPQYRAVQTRRPRAPVTGVTGPKQT
ncbi:hypothetical protein F1602_04525 [Pseudomonas putida]|nr:hypothetical protein F1602_04525 [Pseudomonas putida]